MSKTVGVTIAPWTERQAETLNKYQTCGTWHPFTCPDHSPVSLIANVDGLFCPMCTFQQDWAHNFMLDEQTWLKR